MTQDKACKILVPKMYMSIQDHCMSNASQAMEMGNLTTYMATPSAKEDPCMVYILEGEPTWKYSLVLEDLLLTRARIS